MKIDPRHYFGLILLLALVILAGILALGNVDEKSSYGLDRVLMLLGVLGGAYGNWAFGSRHDEPPEAKP